MDKQAVNNSQIPKGNENEDLSIYSREHLEWRIKHQAKMIDHLRKFNDDVLKEVYRLREEQSQKVNFKREGNVIYMNKLQAPN